MAIEEELSQHRSVWTLTNHYLLYKNSYMGTKLKKKQNQIPMKTVLEVEGTRVFKILFIQWKNWSLF